MKQRWGTPFYIYKDNNMIFKGATVIVIACHKIRNLLGPTVPKNATAMAIIIIPVIRVIII